MGFSGAGAETVGLSGNLSKPGPGIRLQQLRDPGMIGETTQTPVPETTEQSVPETTPAPEIGGRDGPDPTSYGDWEKNGRCIDFCGPAFVFRVKRYTTRGFRHDASRAPGPGRRRAPMAGRPPRGPIRPARDTARRAAGR